MAGKAADCLSGSWQNQGDNADRGILGVIYIRLEQAGTKVDIMARLEQAYEQCAASVQ